MRKPTLARSTILFLGLALSAQAVLAQTSPAQSPSLGGSIVQMLFGLILVLALLFGALWLLKKLTVPNGMNNTLLRVVGGTNIGTRERIVIVELGQTWLVLGVTPQSINTLAEMPRQAMPPGKSTGVQNMPDFSRWLRQFVDRRGGR